MRERATNIGLLIVAVIVVVAGAVAVWHRGEYGEWPFQSSPNRLEYCGRTYGSAAGETTSRPSHLYHAFTYSPPLAPSREIFADQPITHASGQVCAMGLLLRIDRDHYRMYGLEGGP